MHVGMVTVLFVGFFVALLFFFVLGPVFSLWIQARVVGSKVRFLDIARLAALQALHLGRGPVDTRKVVHAKIRLDTAGFDVSLSDLVRHANTGGSVIAVSNALAIFKSAGVVLQPAVVFADELRGEDVLGLARQFARQHDSPDAGDAPDEERPVGG